MRTMERGVAALVAALVAISPAPRANAAQWHEARIADFVLVTDGKEEYARRTLREFAVFKQALGALAPLTRTVPRMPTQVFALDSGTWRSFAPSRQIAGFFSPRAEANYIVFDRTPTGLSSREVVYHEYMHYVLHNGSDMPLPPWWSEGVAEVFSSLSEHDGKIDFGLIPRARKDEFGYFELMPTSVLFGFDRDSPEFRQHSLPPMFYPQAWLTAHFFLIGRPERGRQAQHYLRAIAEDTPVPQAVQAAFGMSIDELDEEIRAYRCEGRIRGYRLTLGTPLPDAKAVLIKPLPEPVALARLALAGLALGRDTGEAEQRALRALQLDPALPLASAALADVRFHQERDSEALDLARKVPAGDPEAAVAAGRVQWQLVDRALRPRQRRAGSEATTEELIDAALSQDQGRREPSAGEIATLQEARRLLLPLADNPDRGLEANLVIVDIDELLRDRAPEVRLAAIQPAVGRYPTHAELALAEARACAELGRRAAAIASASRAARYARSPALRRWIEGWIADLEAATGASR